MAAARRAAVGRLLRNLELVERHGLRRIDRSNLQHIDKMLTHHPLRYVPTSSCTAFNGTTPSPAPTGSSRSPWNVSTVPVQLGAAGTGNE